MAIPIQSQIFNPVTGVFGTGQMQIFGPGMSGSWAVPPGVGKVRVRMFGGGGTAGGGGGFTLKAIYDLTGVTSVPVIVASTAGTSSFGSYCSATGGTATSGSYGGTGIGGDINTSGGNSVGGGVGSLFGNGSGTAANIGVSGSFNSPSGLFNSGGYTPSANLNTAFSSGISSPFSIDLLGTGPGSAANGGTNNQGVNGGGGYIGSFPGGGGQTTVGAPGMVIVEW